MSEACHISTPVVIHLLHLYTSGGVAGAWMVESVVEIDRLEMTLGWRCDRRMMATGVKM